MRMILRESGYTGNNLLLFPVERHFQMTMVRVPATIANMGPGFDSFGMAVSLYNTFHF